MNDGPGHGIKSLKGLDFREESPSVQEVMADRPGRVFNRIGPRRHSMESPRDAHREAKRRFAKRLADFLEERLNAAEYDRLIIFSTPVTLGDLRASLSDQVLAKISDEIPKDLTHLSNEKLIPHIEAVLAI